MTVANNGSTASTYTAVYDTANANLALNGVVITGFANQTKNGGRGSAVYVNNSATLTVTDSTISGNTATNVGFGNGSAIYMHGGGTLTISESTIGNTAEHGPDGGAIYSPSSGNTVTIENSTIAGNSSPTQPMPAALSKVRASPETVTLNSTIVGQNTSSGGTAKDITGTVTNQLIDSLTGRPWLEVWNNETGVSPGFTSFILMKNPAVRLLPALPMEQLLFQNGHPPTGSPPTSAEPASPVPSTAPRTSAPSRLKFHRA